MELLERVREIGSETPALRQEAVNAARQSLLREIAREERARAERLAQRRRWIGGASLAGGLAAAALVIGVVANPIGAPTAAAAVLEEAAATTLTTEVLNPAAGQYIRLDESYEQSNLGYAPEEGVEHDVDYTVSSSRSLYVPADRSEDWISEVNPQTVTVTRGDPELADDIAAWLEQELGTATGAAGIAAIEAYPGGRIMAGDGWETHDFRLNTMERYYDEMPRDPAALLDWIESYEPEPGVAPPVLVDLYGFNLAPPDLRASIFGALALQEGASVLTVQGDITSIAYPERGENTARAVIDVDTARGLIVGFGHEETTDDGTTTMSDNFGRLTISLADTAPEGIRIDG